MLHPMLQPGGHRHGANRAKRLAVFVAALAALAPSSSRAGSASEDGLWTEIGLTQLGPAELLGAAHPVRRFRLDHARLGQVLAEAPLEFSDAAGVVMTLPLPDGGYTRVRIEQSPILSPELQEESPELRGYRAQGVDDPTATGRLDLTPAGFHAMLITAEGSVYVDPVSDSPDYISYWKEDVQGEPFECGEEGSLDQAVAVASAAAAANHPSGDGLRTYRLAISATGEYTRSQGGVAQAQAQIATTVNRVTAIFEREVAVSFLLTATNIYADAATDPFTGGSPGAMLSENQAALDATVGDANYDIGHVFSDGIPLGSGRLGSVCASGRKAGGATSGQTRRGSFFDGVLHEIGHQLGANHTLNGNAGLCRAGFVQHSAYEPGSGSTLMSYAGVCPGQNVQALHDKYFHTRNFDEMTTLRDGTGACGLLDATGNTPPTVEAGPDCRIPTGTPFRLTALGEDADGDPLTFNWEQFDLGMRDGSPQPTFTWGPLFRSRPATASPTRTFPRLVDILSGAPTPFEVLPGVSRTLNFRVTARDNRARGGGVDYDSTTVTVDGSPFVCTSPGAGAILECGDATSIGWTVGGGHVSPNVGIQFSSDGGASFTPLVGSTQNDGSHGVTVPTALTSSGRVMVEAASECFFSVSGEFSVVDTTAPLLTAPADVLAECTSPTDTAVALGTPSVSDLCDAAVSVANDGLAAYPFGATAVTWTASDDSDNESADVQTVSVADTTPPEISCNAAGTITPPDAPISFTATATDVCDVTPSLLISGFDCFKFTKKGKRIDKSCAVALAGDTVTILDSGGVGGRVAWTVEATDGSGNRSERSCGVRVVNPGRRTWRRTL